MIGRYGAFNVSCLSTTVSQLFEPQLPKIVILRTAAHIYVYPGNAPAIITQYVPWMERQFNACQTPRSMYLSIFNSFPVIRTPSAKYRRFHVPQPIIIFRTVGLRLYDTHIFSVHIDARDQK